MRRHGVIDNVRGLGRQDNLCWSFAERADFLGAAVDFLLDGLELGQRLVYVDEGRPDQLRRDLRDLGPIDQLVGSGTLVVCPVEAFCDPSVGVVASRQLAYCDDQLEQAVLHGFTGVRFAANVTRLAVEPLSWLNHTHWEQVADTYMESRPVAALCGYDRTVLGDSAVTALSAVHPLRHGVGSPFGLFVLDGEVHLEGEIDASQTGVAHHLLASIPVPAHDVVVDVAHLRFADGAATSELARFARRLGHQGRRVVLRNASPLLRRVWDVLGYSSAVPVEFAA